MCWSICDEKKTSRKCEERKESVPNNWWVFFSGWSNVFWREKDHVRDGKRLDRYGDDDDGVPTSALEGLV